MACTIHSINIFSLDTVLSAVLAILYLHIYIYIYIYNYNIRLRQDTKAHRRDPTGSDKFSLQNVARKKTRRLHTICRGAAMRNANATETHAPAKQNSSAIMLHVRPLDRSEEPESHERLEKGVLLPQLEASKGRPVNRGRWSHLLAIAVRSRQLRINGGKLMISRWYRPSMSAYQPIRLLCHR